ncbi:MAG: bacillithiol biosynthesis cysteine-adding enzyme BshC [Ignavibacteria bacterium]|nr:bacillithiol biosynthesis cysteine-adding enzyme BshC [Ignavibacteria bacterium]
MEVNYKKLPGFSRLFTDYIYDFNLISAFYEHKYDDINSFVNAIEKRKNHYSIDRGDITRILTEQNKSFNSSKKAFENISKLKSKNTFVVVTGQQIGILTGNYYTILKAVNAIQLSEFLSKKFHDYDFVPVFWLECEDHDFSEINNINIFDKDNNPANLKYFEGGEEKEKYLQPVGTIIADEYIETFINNLFNNLIQTEFTESLSDYSKRAYRSGIDLKTSFARFLNYILKEKGLVFIDPSDKEIKKLLIPVFEKELNTYPQGCELMIDTSAKLEVQYEPQIKPKPVNLFYIYENSRYLLEPSQSNAFSLKNARKKFEKQFIMDNLYEHPEYFSPNVALRPVCQDFLLPSVSYIGGPSEVAYFAQLKSFYRFFNNSIPLIFPRTSVTIIESRIQNFLLKYDIAFEELFNVNEVTKKIMKSVTEINVDDVFSSFIGSFNGLVYETGDQIRRIDKNLETLFQNKSAKFLESLGSVKNKITETQIKQNENTVKKLKSIISNVYPDGYLQERHINIIYFLNKYGPEFIETLFEKIDLFAKGHQNILVN